jgi:ADP-ribose pyrophosphatase YjhB (NUDIX family)
MTSMTSGPSDSSPKVCDGHSVGVIVINDGGQVLIGDRVDGAGAAPVAGHIYDAHPNPRAAARAEVREEVGLIVTHLEQVAGGWRPNRCKRGDGPQGPGHVWHVFHATAAGDLQVDPGSYTRVRWADRDDLTGLAKITVQKAHGCLSAGMWEAAPGIEPVWVLWLHQARLITVAPAELEEIEHAIENETPANHRGAGGRGLGDEKAGAES